MALKTNTAVIVPSSNNQSWEKASAFINVSVRKPDGSKRKVGALPLRQSKAYEAALITRLSEDPSAIEKMADVLEIDFQLVSNEPLSADALGF